MGSSWRAAWWMLSGRASVEGPLQGGVIYPVSKQQLYVN